MMSKTIVPSVIFATDFDGTVTQKDTSYLAFRSTNRYINGAQDERSKHIENWENRGKWYFQNYSEILAKALRLFPRFDGFKDSVEEFIKDIDKFGLDFRRKLADSEIFDDVIVDNSETIENEIIYHKNSKEVLKAIKEEKQIICKVLSVNWFPELLSTSLKGCVDQDDIVCAVLPTHNKSSCPSTPSEPSFGECASGSDKKQWIKKWLKDYNCPIIYVGDSLTDLLALLEATYGVVYGCNQEFREIATHFKINLKPLNEFEGKDKNCEDCTLYTTNSWDEIKQFVFKFK